MRVRKSAVYNTFLIEWESSYPRCIVGLTGMDRPSVCWHLMGMWRRRRVGKG